MKGIFWNRNVNENNSNLVNITTNHVEDGIENLHVELLHCQQLLLGLVEGERAGVHPPQAGPGDDWWERWGQVTTALIILNSEYNSFR